MAANTTRLHRMLKHGLRLLNCLKCSRSSTDVFVRARFPCSLDCFGNLVKHMRNKLKQVLCHSGTLKHKLCHKHSSCAVWSMDRRLTTANGPGTVTTT